MDGIVHMIYITQRMHNFLPIFRMDKSQKVQESVNLSQEKFLVQILNSLIKQFPGLMPSGTLNKGAFFS